jgi:hypothetical protein
VNRRQPTRLRRQAAERVLDGSGSAPTDIPELAAEIEAMTAITKLLEELPSASWAPIPTPPVQTARERRTTTPTRSLNLSRTVAAVAAAVCLVIGFGAGALLESGHGGSGAQGNRTSGGPSIVLRPLGAQAANSLAVAEMPGPGQMLLRVAHLPPSPPGTYYELWLMTNLRRLTPVASFRVDASGRARLDLRLPDNPDQYRYLDISLQQLGHGTDHSPDSVLRGSVA